MAEELERTINGEDPPEVTLEDLRGATAAQLGRRHVALPLNKYPSIRVLMVERDLEILNWYVEVRELLDEFSR